MFHAAGFVNNAIPSVFAAAVLRTFRNHAVGNFGVFKNRQDQRITLNISHLTLAGNIGLQDAAFGLEGLAEGTKRLIFLMILQMLIDWES